MPAFLLEIGVEEIPDGMIAAAQAELERGFRELIERERLAGEGFAVRSYSTPRRLALLAEGLLAKQVDIVEQVVGPSTKVAFKDGVPTPAAIAFAKKSGVDVSALETIQNAKGEYVAANVRRVGRMAGDVLTAELPGVIGGIYWPKNMYWRVGRPERFVRPIRWLLALLDEEIVPVQFAGLTADGVSYGHRVLHGDVPVVVKRPGEYTATLKAAFVQVDVEERRQHIRKALDAAARQLPGARWRENKELVDTVTNLTEWPSVVLGGFDASYLDLPEEVLVTVMRDHQKYFALEDSNKELLPNFLAVLNVQVDAAGEAIIRHGNERVLRARFNDARFFWDVDQNIPLEKRVEMLKHVTFHKDLGSYWEKTNLNAEVAQRIARSFMGFMDVSRVENAVRISKADLTTEMVKEFTELQGIVGGLYARKQGHPSEVSDAIYEQYRPQGSGDTIPETVLGAVLALADKMSTVTDMFRHGLAPTGSRDPFALRRAGSGVVRIIAENSVARDRLHLPLVINTSLNSDEQTSASNLRSAVSTFMFDRFESYLQEVVGLNLQAARAVRKSGAASSFEHSAQSALGPVGYGYVVGFARALNDRLGSHDLQAVAELHKRASNILRQAVEMRIDLSVTVEESVLQLPAEVNLVSSVRNGFQKIRTSYIQNEFRDVIATIESFRQPLSEFFDSVMVLDQDSEKRQARLWAISYTKHIIGWAADFSELASIQGTVAEQ